MSIEIKKLEHTYNENTPFSHAALKGIDLSIPEGKVTAIIGQTGSGKSTLVQHLNGLLIPTAGTLDICGFHIQPLLKIKDVKQLRKEVGLVFQFPEYQLFEETIGKDIAFGRPPLPWCGWLRQPACWHARRTDWRNPHD